ncbi:MAG TPA: hypothetical protein VFG21_07305, partial [Xanthomonadaceae bacterium]|nr:hypothetical protein [Xanthomonadaceae bacterium]
MEQYPLRALSLLAFLLAPVVTTAETIVERGHSAVWYDPARSGEGWLVEILDSDLATITWFTYDEQGNQRWLYGVGHIEADEAGSYIRFAQLFSTHGGRFGPEFDPTDVQHVTVGEATLRFADCERGVFSYSAYDQTQAIEIQRLSRTMAAGCAPVHGVPGQPVFEYAGQSGSWYDTSHSGEGFQLQWSEDNRALLTWYSYDTDGDQYWMIGTGQYENGRIVFPELFSTRGARFGAGFDSTDVELIPWGSLVFELTCNEGTASYDSSLPEFGSGTQQLSRLTIAASLDCPWTAPKLSDLYSFSLRELPVSVPGHHLDRVQSRSIADDGTVVGVIGTDGSGNFQLLRIRPDESEWQILTAVEVGFWPVTIAPSGAHVVANRQVAPDPSRAYEPSLFRSDSGWEPLWNLILSNSRASGSSQDAFHVVGTGRNESG